MQYQVPQFIEVEDKIFGPLTFKQFAYLAGGGGASVLFFTFFPMIIAAIFSMPFIALSIALAFIKINDRPFVDALGNALTYYANHKLYLWKQRDIATTRVPESSPEATAILSAQLPKITEGKLKDIAWSLNIKDRGQMGITERERSGFEI